MRLVNFRGFVFPKTLFIFAAAHELHAVFCVCGAFFLSLVYYSLAQTVFTWNSIVLSHNKTSAAI